MEKAELATEATGSIGSVESQSGTDPLGAVEEKLAAARSGLPWRKIVAALLGLSIIGTLIYAVGAGQVLDILRTADPLYLSAALLCFVPQFLVIGWRWSRMTRAFHKVSLAESIRLILATNTANVVLPSKLGDLGKGLVLARTGKISLAGGMSLVVLEKLLDVAALALYMLLGTAYLTVWSGTELSPLHGGAAFSASLVGCGALGAIAALYLWPLGSTDSSRSGPVGKLVKIALVARQGVGLLRQNGASGLLLFGSTATIWGMHLIQIWLFFQAVGAQPDLARYLTLAPLAIFVGLIPLTFGGFGHRDAAFVALFSPIPEPTMLAAALLVNTRYVIPALVGWPFFHRYAVKA